MQRTKILATIGPACESIESIRQLIKAGVDVIRFNLSHNTRSYHSKILKNVRIVSKKMNYPVAIIFDLQGPKLRTGNIASNGINIKENEKIGLVYEGLKIFFKDSVQFVPIQFLNLYKYVKKGQIIYIDDASIELKVIEVKNKIIFCFAVNAGCIKSHKGINAPGAKIKHVSLTEKDILDLDFAVKENVDFIALSYVSSHTQVMDLRKKIFKLENKYGHKKYDFKKPKNKGKWSGECTRIISKIENPEAVKNFDKILEVSDAIMIARGDLGIEIPFEDLPIIQKKMIKKSLIVAKPVIVATQMLNSMIDNPYPTRAEVSDSANAVLDGSDAVMLSGETATGKYSIKSVQAMYKIIHEAEPVKIEDAFNYEYDKKFFSLTVIMVSICKRLAQESGAKVVVCSTTSGFTARVLARYKLKQSIVAFTPSMSTLRQLNLSWGVIPIFLKKMCSYDSFIEDIKIKLKKEKIIKKGQTFIIVTGHPLGYLGEANSVKVEKA